MTTTTLIYQAILVLAMLATTGALYVVLDRANRAGGRPLIVLLGGSLFWLATTLVYTLASSYELALVASKLTYVGITLVPVGWFLFSLEYTGRSRYANAPVVGFLLLEAAVVNAIVWLRTDLVWQSVERLSGTGTGSGVIEFGSWGVAFYAHAAFAYGILFVGATFVLKGLYGSSGVQRGQVVSMLLAVVAPTVGNAVYLALSFAGVLVLDLTPIMFAVSAVAIVVGAYRYSLIEESPLAAEAGVHDRDQPAFLVDDDDTLVDLNVPGAAVLAVDADDAPGEPVDDVFAEQAALRDRYERGPTAADGLELDDPLSGDSYVVTTNPVDAPGAAHEAVLFELVPKE